MAATWILVADRSDARVFKQSANRPLKRLQHLTHPESRMDNRELETDRPGTVSQTIGSGMHGMARETEPKEHEAQLFAKRLTDLLHEARVRGEYDRLWIVAEPGFLGLLRQNLDAPTQKLIVGSLDRNLTHEGDAEVERHLAGSMGRGEVRIA
jgi:protein required for attachment to host cells